MGNSSSTSSCCLNLCDLFVPEGSTDNPRVLYHTCSIHPSSGGGCGRSRCRRIVPAAAEEDITDRYELGEELGRGQFGVIRHCCHRSSGERLACKSIAKAKLTSAGDVKDVQREIEIMQQLVGHPHVVGLWDVVEDDEFVHMVMELCEGGELFDRIVERKMYTERDAAKVCKTIAEVIQFCNENGIIHRDLKPENILLVDSSASSSVKVADFGLAVHFRAGQSHSGMAGSAYYIAPEVLRGEYGPEVDVWSAGVVLYVMLCGVPPFWDETEEGIFDAIRYGHLDLSSEPWPRLTASVKHLVRGMLCKDATKRLTPAQILNHEWIIQHATAVDEEAEQQRELTAGSLARLNLGRRSINADLGSWRSVRTTTSSSSSDSDTGFLEGLLVDDVQHLDDDDDDDCGKNNSNTNSNTNAAAALVPTSADKDRHQLDVKSSLFIREMTSSPRAATSVPMYLSPCRPVDACFDATRVFQRQVSSGA